MSSMLAEVCILLYDNWPCPVAKKSADMSRMDQGFELPSSKCSRWSLHLGSRGWGTPCTHSSQPREELDESQLLSWLGWLYWHSSPPYPCHLFYRVHIFLHFISSHFSFAAPSKCVMNPGLASRLKPPLKKQALAFIFLCGFGFARIKVTLAWFVWISMKTSNLLLCNIPYFNKFNNYSFFFLIKSLETETLERDQNSGI